MIHRTKKKEYFTQIDNGVLRTDHLSLTAKGLLSYLLSFPDDWKFTVKDIENATRTKRTKLMTAMAELEEEKLIKRITKRVNGKFEVEFEIFETPYDGCIYEPDGKAVIF